MAAGLISENDFVLSARQFAYISNLIQDNWELRNIYVGKETVYLYKRTSKSMETLPSKSEVSVENVEDQYEEVDEACLSSTNTEMGTTYGTYVYEYHVVYSASYSVPVLYFNVYKPDGSLVSLEEVWQWVPSHYRHKLEVDRWSFLTQQEHPLLGRPFYQLHPCHTEDFMKQVSSTHSSNRNYLISWLSSVGPVVGLDLPLEYEKHLQTMKT